MNSFSVIEMLMLNTIIVLINGFKKIYVPIDVILNVVIIILWPFLQIINVHKLILLKLSNCLSYIFETHYCGSIILY